MIYFTAACRFRLLPRFKRYFVHDMRNEPTKHHMWNATWLTFMVARTDKVLSERMITLLRKSAREIVTLDNLKEKFTKAVQVRTQKALRWHHEREDRNEAEMTKIREENSRLYNENHQLRAAIRVVNKAVLDEPIRS